MAFRPGYTKPKPPKRAKGWGTTIGEVLSVDSRKQEPAPKEKWVPVKSSHLESVLYDPDDEILVVKFLNAPKDILYAYAAVSPKTYKEFLAAKSQGEFFQRHIVGKFRVVKFRNENKE